MAADSEVRKKLLLMLGAEELEARMRRIRDESGGLLDDGAIVALIADEQGVSEQHFSTLAELGPDTPVSARCRIDSIEPPRTFQGRDREGRLRKLRVSDGTASMALTLWDEETEMVEQLGLKAGSRIRILSAVLKTTRFGPEIHVGRNGFIVPEEAPASQGPPRKRDIKDLDEGRVIVKGVLLSFNISGRGKARSAYGRLFDGTGEIDVFFPEILLEFLSGASVGTELEVAGAEVDSHEGRGFLRCDERTRIRIL